MHTIEFKIYLAAFVHEQTLIALRVLDKEWNGVAHALIIEVLRSGELIFHVGKDESYQSIQYRPGRCKLVTRVIFLLNVKKVGCYAFVFTNLVVIENPRGR
ncbi:hypothetical protein TrLO_g12295 [Triparma laevis f. longispina]|uniref:Uncharacterized protein n=1 Tax=Triparma laevis f. longispina TaxID=1714387 RepID=A0A9W7FQZ1_9STRA|nr:hypothetical protein TrLO_g12295 [Triparma laevis f. longispina]